MRIFKNHKGKVIAIEGSLDDTKDAIWIDIDNPDADNIKSLNETFNLKIPDSESLKAGVRLPRLIALNNNHMFTPRLLYRESKHDYHNAQVVFVLTERILISMRFVEPECIKNFAEEVENERVDALPNGVTAFFALMAQLATDYNFKIEEMSALLNDVAHEVFAEDLDGQNSLLHKSQINRIARAEDINGKIMNSLMGLSLLGDYFKTIKKLGHEDLRYRFESNMQSLIDNSNFISDRTDFVLNAVMSIINLEQNRVVNVFSVFTVIFTLPTLLVGLWGMNFVFMPELKWHWGYYVALALIVLSGIIPYRLVRKLGWL